MKFENRSIIEVLGAIAVVLSLLFVAFQIQQANNIALAATTIELRGNFSSINETIMSEPELAELMHLASNTDTIFEGADRIRMYQFVLRLMNVYLATITAYERGLVPVEDYNAIFDDARASITQTDGVTVSPGLVLLWREGIDTYPAFADTELWVYLDELIGEHEQTE